MDQVKEVGAAEVTRAEGVPPGTLYAWLSRYKVGGLESLQGKRVKVETVVTEMTYMIETCTDPKTGKTVSVCGHSKSASFSFF
jgi:transposase-like protein